MPPRPTPNPNSPHLQWLGLLSVWLLLASLLGVFLYDDRQGVSQREQERLLKQGQVLHDYVAQQLSAIRYALDNVRSDPLRHSSNTVAPLQTSERLQALTQTSQVLQVLHVIDLNGKVLASSLPNLENKPFGKLEHYQHALEASASGASAQTLYVIPPYVNLRGIRTIAFAMTVYDAGDQPVGLVITSIEPASNARFLEATRYAPDMRITGVHGDGSVFLTVPKNADLLGDNLNQPGYFFASHLGSGQPYSQRIGLTRSTNRHSMLVHYTVRPPELHLNAPLVLAIGRDIAAVFAPWQERALRMTQLFILLLACSISLLWWLQKRHRNLDAAWYQANADARSQRLRLHALAQNVPGMLYQYLLRPDGSGVFLYCSDSIADIYEVTPAEAIHHARAVFDRIHPDDTQRVAEHLQASAQQLSLLHDEYRVQLPQRGLRWVAGVARPQETDDGAVLWHGYIRDVTEAKQRAQELEQAKEMADAANAAKSSFVANISHEIRTPMNAVLGMLQLLHNTTLSSQQQDYCTKAQGAAQSLLALLNDVLDFSKIEAGKLEIEQAPFSVSTLVRNLSAILEAGMGSKPVTLHFDIDPRLPSYLRGDALRLQQVLLNLGSNALKFTPSGQVIVRLALLPDETTATHTSVAFSVTDTGIGIAAQRLEAIFDSFTQAESSTTRQYGGTGLGLSIARSLVNAMGGELSVQSSLGQGSCFQFTLHLAVEAGAALPPAPLTPGTPVLTGLRILLVEDNRLNQEIASTLLTQAGAQVSVASNGAQALTTLHQQGAQAFDAVLMDIQMPIMDGLEATRQIRQTMSTTLPILAMTANASAQDRSDCLDAGMQTHLAKPIDQAQLIASLLHYTGHGTPAASTPENTSAALTAVSAPTPSPGHANEAIQLEAALERLAGNRALYARLLRDFVAQHADRAATAPVRQALHAQDGPLAQRLLHTYKGLAATLGAQTLSDLAATALQQLRLDDLCEQPTPAPTLGISPDLLAALDAIDTLHPHALQPLLQASAPWLDAEPNTTIGVATATITNMEASTHAQDLQPLQNLQHLANAHDMQALATFANLPNHLRQQPAAQAVSQALNALDFEQAQQQLALWIRHLTP